jgi:hypothetical protein
MQGVGYRNHPLVRLTLGGTMVLLAGFWVSMALMYFNRMSLTTDSVIRYYLGSEAEFIEPRTYGSMLEVTHVHLARLALVALLLTHLAIFMPWGMRWRVILIVLTFLSALGGEVAGWLVRFVSPAWAPLKIVSFLTLEACFAVLLMGLAIFLFRPAPPPTALEVADSPTD